MMILIEIIIADINVSNSKIKSAELNSEAPDPVKKLNYTYKD